MYAIDIQQRFTHVNVTPPPPKKKKGSKKQTRIVQQLLHTIQAHNSHTNRIILVHKLQLHVHVLHKLVHQPNTTHTCTICNDTIKTFIYRYPTHHATHK